jgi:hypothetical protein
MDAYLAKVDSDKNAEIGRLRVECAELRAENRRLLAVLASLPGADRLLADLKTDMKEPPAPTEGSTSAESTLTSRGVNP